MLNFPHEYQLDAKDCGPTCVKIIAKYFRSYFVRFVLMADWSGHGFQIRYPQKDYLQICVIGF
jgi:hypothetical protein